MTSNFNAAATNAHSNILASKNTSNSVLANMQNLSNYSETAGQAETLFDAASTIAQYTGVGAGYAVALKLIGTAAQILKHGFLASSMSLGSMRLYYLKSEHNNAATETFVPALHTIPDNNYQPISLTQLNDALTLYHTQLQTTMGYVQNNDRNNAFDAMINLFYLDSILSKEYYISASQMLTAAPQYEIQTGNGEYFTNSIIIGSIEDNRSKRIALTDFFTAYVIDSTDNSLIDSILFIGNDIISDGLDLFDSLSFYNTEIENIPVEPYLLNLGVNEQTPFIYGQTKSVKAIIKNIGQSDINNVYAKINIGGGFNAIQDSIYIGTSIPNQIDTLEFQVTAPVFDTIVHFTIDLNASNGQTDGIGGALIVNQGSQSNLSENKIEEDLVKLWPNPAKNQLNISANYSDYKIDILNLEGRIIKSLNSKDSSLTIDLEGFENGIYLIKGSKIGSTIFQEKFIKL
ncbi:MAG: T9SS type A sorting domain-containing protein [Bacteroidota bacterium]